MIFFKTYSILLICWFSGVSIYLLFKKLFRKALTKIYIKAKSIPPEVSAKLAYDLSLVSISAGGFGVLAGITSQSTPEEALVRISVSLMFITLGAIILFKNILNQ